MMHCHVAVIGCGPYGLAIAAYLKKIPGLELRIFGEPMSFWAGAMPKGMLLRSSWQASQISDPDSQFTLDAFCRSSGLPATAPVPLETFVKYGQWFQRSVAPDIDSRVLVRLERLPSGFRLTFDRGVQVAADRVVLATGLGSFAYRPPQFRALPPETAPHTSALGDLDRYSGKHVAVIGSGQSALESAALLQESGAFVQLIVRRPSIHWLGWKAKLERLGPFGRMLFSPADVGPAGISHVVASPDLFMRLPLRMQDRLRTACLRPAGARWLMERLGDLSVLTGRSVLYAVARAHSVRLTLDDYSTRTADFTVLGTGYRVDVARLPYLTSPIVAHLQTNQGFPVLNSAFESSVPGLHFVGAPATGSFGPLLHFVSGTRYCALALAAFFRKEDLRVAKKAA
jgi:FAD-dependent urate hydroxylase